MKVFQINDCDWYMAPTLEGAIQQAMSDSGLPRDEVCDSPRELSEADMDDLTFTDDEGNRRTFTEELRRRLTAGARTEMFASTEF